jgi:hypothetical protein
MIFIVIYIATVLLAHTSPNMSKVDIKVRVEGVKLFFNEGGVRKTDKQYFIKSEYPVCALFDSDVPVIRETVFFVPNEEDMFDLSTDSLRLDTFINKKCILTVNGTAEHSMYGTMRMKDVEVVSMAVSKNDT